MMKYACVSILLLMMIQSVCGQSDRASRRTDWELIFSANLLPVNQKDKAVSFSYSDAEGSAIDSIDVINAAYTLRQKPVNIGFTIGGAYFLTNWLKMTLTATPHFNSFRSNTAKNGRTYGIQFDLGLDYNQQLSSKLNLTAGAGLTRILGGFGITSGGPTQKEYLVVNGNPLYDDNIGFHIIDNTWATTGQLGFEYGAGLLKFFTKVGYQMPFARSSRMNFAGALEDGSIKWNRKSYDDTNVMLDIAGQRITDNTIQDLPYRFGGFVFQVGIIAHYQDNR
jgi:hypothetical protein